jgi:hypothetical protein
LGKQTASATTIELATEGRRLYAPLTLFAVLRGLADAGTQGVIVVCC